jgi:hypothetical protein
MGNHTPDNLIFFPSACISHENLPIGPTEERMSLTLYTAGALFRWARCGFQCVDMFAVLQAYEYSLYKQQGDAMWGDAWQAFPTMEFHRG